MSNPRPHSKLSEDFGTSTLAIRGGQERTAFGETAEPIFLTQGYVYEHAADAEAAFAGQADRFIYSRYGNPTVAAFEERMRLIEGAEACFATATGMSAVFTSLAALVKSGSRVVAGSALFGGTLTVLDKILGKWGVKTDYVRAHVLSDWEEALATPADVVIFETPSNPMQDLVDVAKVSELAHKAGAVVILDNVFATPILQKPLELGADIVVYSATKHIDGQGRVLGGAILGPNDYIEGPVKQLIRATGPSLSPFNAWVLLKGLETLSLRVKAQADNALSLGRWLEEQDQIRGVRYPFLESHPQYALAREQMTGGGTVLTLDLNSDGGPEENRTRTFAFLDALQLVDVSNNLGDLKSLATHPATTTHSKLTREARLAVGITDTTVRFSVGLEDLDDLKADLAQALGKF